MIQKLIELNLYNFLYYYICFHLTLLINLDLSSNRDCWHEFCQS